MDLKIERWRENLLDMTLRNRLLNFKPRTAVRIVEPRPSVLFDGLINGRTLTMREQTEEESKREALSPADRGREEVLIPYDPRGAEGQLKRMRLRARGSVQEQGVNILYLAFGMVHWSELGCDDIELLSPLVLVPVELIKEGPLFPFRIRTADDDIVVNPNFAYKLRTGFGISLPEWPEEPEPIDSYLEKVKASLSCAPRWRVEEGAFLGLFSFAKLSMYQELQVEQERLSCHPFIKALAGDPSLLPPPTDHPRAEMLDDMVRPSDSYQLLDADSSQQEAIEMAKGGMSFVLQGPPGTGKSQTISNIIAEALAQDKKVLFVSEKMAALEVVKGRLDDKGLGDFTMEIHSRKANKTAVIEELRRCMQPTPAPMVPTEDLQRLEKVRDDLNRYVRALHEVQAPLGRSTFHAYSRLAALHDAPDLMVAIPDVGDLRWEDLEDRLRTVRRLQTGLPLVERMDGHPWKDLRTERWKTGDESVVATELRRLRERLQILRERATGASGMIDQKVPADLNGTKRVIGLLHIIGTTPYPPEHWLVPGRPGSLLGQCDGLEAAYQAKALDDRWVSENYRDEVRDLDARPFLERVLTRYAGFFRFLSSDYKADRARLQGLRRDDRKLSYPQLVTELRQLVAVSERDRALTERERAAHEEIGLRFTGPSTDWSELRKSLAWTSGLLAALDAPLTPGLTKAICDPQGPATSLAGVVQEVEAAEEEYDLSLRAMEGLFRAEGRKPFADMAFDDLESFAEVHLDDLASIGGWVEAAALERACQERGLADLVSMGRQRQLPSTDLVTAYEKRTLRLWLDHVHSGDPCLRDFRSEDHEEAIDRFKRLDERQQVIAQHRLRAKLTERIGQALDVHSDMGAELAVLKHELAKKKRFKQIRQLFQQCPNIILRLKPCLLMSPLSVSQFLDPATVRFDLVVFDEASQVRPEDAVGSIMRGAQVIVVGDSKQLPPTTFFKIEPGEVTDEEELEDLESILDECTALNIQQQMLLWHYRSRDESLIAFSNQRIYGGRLNTFPSAGHDAGEWGVSFVHVPEGVYDRGGIRTNPVEARKVAELVFEHFTRTPERTLGVIAFSESQQMAIIDAVDDMRKERPEFERFFSENGGEEFFVKNLENAQGDERDVMFFSVGYGRDAKGRMYQNYGPLNAAGGERRLNVAITRARMHIKLIASITAKDVNGSTSQGAMLLKDYLSYAASGGKEGVQLPAQGRPDPNLATSGLEDDIYDALTGEGLPMQRRVGRSSYRVDLAVEDRDRPGSFMLGILCDGDSYRSGRTARDRDRLREKVLKGLGWRTHRIWARDWATDREGEIAEVMNALVRIEEAKRIEKADVLADGALAMSVEGELSVKLQEEEVPAKLVELVTKEGPIHAADLKERLLMGSDGTDELIDMLLKTEEGRGTVTVKGEFIWPKGMVRPPVRGPARAGPMVLERVATEEIGEAVLYTMGSEVQMSRSQLIERTARFYRHESLTEPVRERIDTAIEALVASGFLAAASSDTLRRCF